jgi:hypothetical protein
LIKLLLSASILSLVSAALIFGALGWGQVVAQAPLPLANLDACTLPCWNDIYPYQTELEQADALLQNAGYNTRRDYFRHNFVAYSGSSRACAVRLSYVGTRVSIIWLSECYNVRLGDLMAIMGAPEAILPSATTLSFRNEQVTVTVWGDQCDQWFEPFAEVKTIYLDLPERWIYRTEMIRQEFFPWRGFMNRRHYQQREPSMPKC